MPGIVNETVPLQLHSASGKPPREVHSFDVLRMLAAVHVYLFHTMVFIDPRFPSTDPEKSLLEPMQYSLNANGHAAVSLGYSWTMALWLAFVGHGGSWVAFFFILSGFGPAHSRLCAGEPEAPGSLLSRLLPRRATLSRRLASVYPTYLFALLTGVVCICSASPGARTWYGGLDAPTAEFRAPDPGFVTVVSPLPGTPALRTLPLDVLLLQAPIGIPYWGLESYWNIPGWFVSALALMWLCERAFFELGALCSRQRHGLLLGFVGVGCVYFLWPFARFVPLWGCAMTLRDVKPGGGIAMADWAYNQGVGFLHAYFTGVLLAFAHHRHVAIHGAARTPLSSPSAWCATLALTLYMCCSAYYGMHFMGFGALPPTPVNDSLPTAQITHEMVLRAANRQSARVIVPVARCHRVFGDSYYGRGSWIADQDQWLDFSRYAYLPIFALLVWGLVDGSDPLARLLASPPPPVRSLLAQLSLPFYLMQYPVLQLMELPLNGLPWRVDFRGLFFTTSGRRDGWAWAANFCALLVIALVALFFVQQPAERCWRTGTCVLRPGWLKLGRTTRKPAA